MDTQSARNKKIQMNCMNKKCGERIVGTNMDTYKRDNGALKRR